MGDFLIIKVGLDIDIPATPIPTISMSHIPPILPAPIRRARGVVGIGIAGILWRVPARVRVPQRIVRGIAVPVQGLRVARVRHDGVGLDEAPEHRVVAPGHVVIQIARDTRIQALAVKPRAGWRRSGVSYGVGKVRGEGIVDIGYWGDCSRGAGRKGLL